MRVVFYYLLGIVGYHGWGLVGSERVWLGCCSGRDVVFCVGGEYDWCEELYARAGFGQGSGVLEGVPLRVDKVGAIRGL